jgi:hypothetical protein
VPNWLVEDSADSETSTPAASTPIQPPAAPEAGEPGLPNWLNFATGEPSVPAVPTVPSVPSAAGPEAVSPLVGSTEDLDWLRTAHEEEPAPTGQPFESTPASSAFVGGMPLDESTLPAKNEQATPDWLASLDSGTIPAPQEMPAAPAFIMQDEANLGAPDSRSSHPFATNDIPDWLQDTEAEEARPKTPAPAAAPFTQPEAPEKAEGAAAEPASLTPAQMPGWLQAMRPLESVAPSAAGKVDDRRIEAMGPLAGLQGILPGEDLARRYRKPPAYSVKLRISEKQRTYITQMEQLLGDENKPQNVKPETPWSPQWIVRAALAALLILAIVFSVPPSSVPQAPLEMLTFSNQVEKLPDGAPVLLALEYDPGFAGEMRLASLGLIQRLMAHNARISLVSTVPTGPVLGEELLRAAAQDAHNRSLPGAAYAMDQQVANLGYLPGGLTSLQEFASQPHLATRYGFSTNPDSSIWDQAPLRGVDSIQKFSAVIVLTDSGDTGRAWVEQVQPLLGEVPLYMVSTAQAAPMLRPYADGGQVKGLIAGLDGGAIYQQLAQGSTGSLSAWSAYRSGLFLGIVFILFGILLKTMLSALGRRKA